MKKTRIIAGMAAIALLCALSFVSAAVAPEHVYMEDPVGAMSAEERGWLLSEEHQHSLLAQAAQMQAKAEAQAIAERQEQGAEATPPNAPETMPTPEEERISRLAAAPVDPETARMLSVFREDQFPENTDASIRDLQGWANKRVDSELRDQMEHGFTVKSVGVDGIMLESKTKEEAAEEARMEAALEQAADEGVAADAYEAAFTNQAEQMYASAEQATDAQALTMTPDQIAEAELRADAARELQERAMAARARQAHEAMGGYEAMEADSYPSMIEQSAEAYPSGVEHSVKGIMSKLRRKIMDVAAKEIAKHKQSAHMPAARGHSFIASRSTARSHAKAKEGDQWWLQKAPFFLPPPPEWGPMPVTMYTSYYHKPTAGYSHLDYAHGIPLPHADALGMARRTYPQPPFEQPQAGASAEGEAEAGAEAGEAPQEEGAFMELASQEHSAVSAESDESAMQAELEDAEAELEAEAARDDTLLEVEAEAEPESEYEHGIQPLQSSEGIFVLEHEAAKVL